jgi:tetratricopeptide (TPR) repeat protein
MRKALEASPEDLSKMKVYAGMLGDKLRSNPGAPPALVFEAIDVLGRILQREPNDPAALVMMADVSFDQRAFTKALDFYERYLKIEGGDLGARSRYASTLTFLGRYDESIRELRSVLDVEPKNFPALAYLAITYAQKGEVGTAKKIGNDALLAAPSDDARARFSSFVASLDETTSGETANRASRQEPPLAIGKPTQSGLDGLVAALKANPIAGPKFVTSEAISGGKLRLLYRDFPMSQMPPFAKDKFVGGVKSALSQNGLTDVKELLFVDAGSGTVMESVVVSPQ